MRRSLKKDIHEIDDIIIQQSAENTHKLQTIRRFRWNPEMKDRALTGFESFHWSKAGNLTSSGTDKNVESQVFAYYENVDSQDLEKWFE